MESGEFPLISYKLEPEPISRYHEESGARLMTNSGTFPWYSTTVFGLCNVNLTRGCCMHRRFVEIPTHLERNCQSGNFNNRASSPFRDRLTRATSASGRRSTFPLTAAMTRTSGTMARRGRSGRANLPMGSVQVEVMDSN